MSLLHRYRRPSIIKINVSVSLLMKLITRKNWLEIFLRSVDFKMLKYAHLSQSLLFGICFTETSAFKAKKYKLLYIAIIMVFLTYTIYVLSNMQAYPLCSPSHSYLISFLLFNVLFVWGLFLGCDFGWFFTWNTFYKENTWEAQDSFSYASIFLRVTVVGDITSHWTVDSLVVLYCFCLS